MPHLIVEYSANIEDQIALDTLLDNLHASALATGVFPIGGLRVHYMKLHPFHVTQSKYATANHVSGCALRGLRAVGTGRARINTDEPPPAFPDN